MPRAKKKTEAKSIMKCPVCGKFVGDEDPDCMECGQTCHEDCLKWTEDQQCGYCPSCLANMATPEEEDPEKDKPEGQPEEEKFKTTISVIEDGEVKGEYDLDKVVDGLGELDQDEVNEDPRKDPRKELTSYAVSVLKEEMMRRDAQQMVMIRRRIMAAEIKKKQLSDQIKADLSALDRLGSKLSRAVLDPQLYLDEIRAELEEENRLRTGIDKRQLVLPKDDPTTEGDKEDEEGFGPDPSGDPEDRTEDSKEDGQGSSPDSEGMEDN